MAQAVKKVWGRELWVVNNELYCAKYLYVEPGFACSLHRHLVKDETFAILNGSCTLEFGNSVREMGAGDVERIAPRTWHRFSNRGNSLCIILEVSTHHEDSDVERREPSRDCQTSVGV